jgi:hypothetical protein
MRMSLKDTTPTKGKNQGYHAMNIPRSRFRASGRKFRSNILVLVAWMRVARVLFICYVVRLRMRGGAIMRKRIHRCRRPSLRILRLGGSSSMLLVRCGMLRGRDVDIESRGLWYSVMRRVSHVRSAGAWVRGCGGRLRVLRSRRAVRLVVGVMTGRL